MDQKENKNEIKKFLIKLAAITFAIIIIINVTYNLILADKMENLNVILSLNKKENIEQIKNKIRVEIKKGLQKDKILEDEDKKLLIDLYNKLKNEFKTFESKLHQKLYFAGEILNIDAVTGGFNFQNAWTGAYIAAKAISKS